MKKIKFASCRSKRSFLTDIKNAAIILDEVSYELNNCEAKEKIKSSIKKILSIIDNEGFTISNSKRLIKKK